MGAVKINPRHGQLIYRFLQCDRYKNVWRLTPCKLNGCTQNKDIFRIQLESEKKPTGRANDKDTMIGKEITIKKRNTT